MIETATVGVFWHPAKQIVANNPVVRTSLCIIALRIQTPVSLASKPPEAHWLVPRPHFISPFHSPRDFTDPHVRLADAELKSELQSSSILAMRQGCVVRHIDCDTQACCRTCTCRR
jgi:hypothetical protein